MSKLATEDGICTHDFVIARGHPGWLRCQLCLYLEPKERTPEAQASTNGVNVPTFGGTFYERNPAARPYQGRLIEMRSQESLLRNVFWITRDWRKYRGMSLWVWVSHMTGHGSGYSQQICDELGWDYEMKISPTARLPDRETL